MDHELGQIKAGYKADLIMVSLQEAHMIPCHDVTANLVYAAQASDIQHVIIDGTPVMMNRKILLFDEEEVIEEARQTTRNLLKRAGKP
jgi:5-methylthioadenosine/S-adenosylhomocysteine deaminase